METQDVFSAQTVEEAVETGLRELQMDRGEAEVTILDKGSRGFLGIGSRRARVQIAPKVRCEGVVRELVEGVLTRLGAKGEVSVQELGRTVQVRIQSDGTDGLLIGRRGETLQALEHVILRMAARRLGRDAPTIQIDVGGYRERRETQLRQLAETLAERVERSGRRVMTEPLSPAERRIVHRVLEERSGVRTHAGGSGVNKRVIITPASGRGGARRHSR